MLDLLPWKIVSVSWIHEAQGGRAGWDAALQAETMIKGSQMPLNEIKSTKGPLAQRTNKVG